MLYTNAALRITWFFTGQYNTEECGTIMDVIKSVGGSTKCFSHIIYIPVSSYTQLIYLYFKDLLLRCNYQYRLCLVLHPLPGFEVGTVHFKTSRDSSAMMPALSMGYFGPTFEQPFEKRSTVSGISMVFDNGGCFYSPFEFRII